MSSFRLSFLSKFFISGSITAVLFLFIIMVPLVYSADVTIAWDDNNDPDSVQGYYASYGTASGDYQITQNITGQTQCTFTGLQEGKVYYFAVMAYGDTDNKSIYSDEFVYTVPLSSETDNNDSTVITDSLNQDTGTDGSSTEEEPLPQTDSQVPDADNEAEPPTSGQDPEQSDVPDETGDFLDVFVNAGPDQVVMEGSTVYLEATYPEDPGDGTISYLWTQVEGPTVVLSDPASPEPSFVTPPVTTSGADLIFRVDISAGTDSISSDLVNIKIGDNGIKSFPDNVITLNSQNNSQLGILAKDGASIVDLSVVDMEEFKTSNGMPEDMIYGLIDFTVKTEIPGDTVYVVFYLPEPAPEGYIWYKYSPVEGWTDYSEYTEFNTTRDQVTLALTDGGPGDDDSSANGEIIDPSGLGALETSFSSPLESAAEEPSTADTSGGGGGCFISATAHDFSAEPFVYLFVAVICLLTLYTNGLQTYFLKLFKQMLKKR